MKVRKIIMVSLCMALLGGCSAGKKAEKSGSGAEQQKSEKDGSSAETPLSTDHAKLADKTLSIDYGLLEKIPLDGKDAKAYAQENGYENDFNDSFVSPDGDAFEITVQDKNYDWLKENYTFNSLTQNPYLDQNSGSMTLIIAGEQKYENSDGYYPDTVEALKKNLSAAGYTSSGDYPGRADTSGYQVNYYNYTNGNRVFSVVEVLQNGKFSTGVLEVGNAA